MSSSSASKKIPRRLQIRPIRRPLANSVASNSTAVIRQSGPRDVSDLAEHIGQPCLRIDVVELGRHDQRGHGCRPVSAALGTGEEPRLSPQRKSSKSTLGCTVREADPAIFDEAGKPVPTLEHVVDRLGDRGRARQARVLVCTENLVRFD